MWSTLGSIVEIGMTTSIPVAVFGRTGRMAQALTQHAKAARDLAVISCIGARGRTADQIATALAKTPPETVVCDFTNTAAFRELVTALRSVPRRLVSGTSGLTAQDRASLASLGRDVAILQCPNFSLGAHIVRMLIEQLGTVLRHNPLWDVALLDFHHSKKQDPISATSKDWAAAWRHASGKHAAPISALRLGDGVSEHTLLAAGPGERIEILHKTLSLDAPVSGALASVRYLSRQSAGVYTLASVLDMPTA
jgi:4-hydroxy-tetrahydrodipicolinate reductase